MNAGVGVGAGVGTLVGAVVLHSVRVCALSDTVEDGVSVVGVDIVFSLDLNFGSTASETQS